MGPRSLLAASKGALLDTTVKLADVLGIWEHILLCQKSPRCLGSHSIGSCCWVVRSGKADGAFSSIYLKRWREEKQNRFLWKRNMDPTPIVGNLLGFHFSIYESVWREWAKGKFKTTLMLKGVCVHACITPSKALSTPGMWRAIPVHENLTLWWGPCLRNSGCHFHPSSTHFSRVPVAWEALYTIASVKGPLFILETFSFFITLRFPPAFVSVSSLSPHCEKICKRGSILKGPEGPNRCRFHRAGSLTEPVVFHPGGLCPQAVSQRALFKLTFSLQWPISLEISSSLCSGARKEMLKVDSWQKAALLSFV